METKKNETVKLHHSHMRCFMFLLYPSLSQLFTISIQKSADCVTPAAELLETSWFHSIKTDLAVNCLELEPEAANEPVLKWYATPSLPCGS